MQTNKFHTIQVNKHHKRPLNHPDKEIAVALSNHPGKKIKVNKASVEKNLTLKNTIHRKNGKIKTKIIINKHLKLTIKIIKMVQTMTKFKMKTLTETINKTILHQKLQKINNKKLKNLKQIR